MGNYLPRYTIIGGDIHKLVRISKDGDWAQYAWRIRFRNDYYWVPVPNFVDLSTTKRWQLIDIDPEKCPLCKRRNYGR